MAAKSDTWMPLYIADYLRDTMHLTRDQHGGYMLLLMACWDRAGRLPNDPGQLAGIAKASATEWRKLAPVLLPFFEVDGSDLIQHRVISEHEKAALLSEKRRLSGAQGGRPRKQNDSKPKANGLQNGSQTTSQNETPLQEPIGSNLEIAETNVSSLSPGKPERARSLVSTGGKEPIPDGFPGPTDVGHAESLIAAAGVVLSAAEHAKRFRSYAKTHNRLVADWFEAWVGWIETEIRKAPLAAVKVELPPAKPWAGPADVRKAFVAAKSEEWTRAYIDPAGWQDVPERALIPATGTAARKILAEARGVLASEKLQLLEKAA